MDRLETVRKIKNVGFPKESVYINDVWEAFEANEVDLENMRESYRSQSEMFYRQKQENDQLKKDLKESMGEHQNLKTLIGSLEQTIEAIEKENNELDELVARLEAELAEATGNG